MENKLNIVNSHLKFKRVNLIEPAASYYLQIAAEIDHSSFPVFIGMSPKKRRVIEQSKKWCAALEKQKGIISAVVFKAQLIPPGKGQLINEKKGDVHVAKFDFVILIEADSVGTMQELHESEGFREIEAIVRKSSVFTHLITATNIRRINSVDHRRQGVFLFNYFFASSLAQNLAIWEYTAGWFQQETGLDNSTVLLPTEPSKSKYTIINHCRWNRLSDILPSLLFKKTFHTYVLDNFYANNVGAMPILYKLA